MSKVSDLSFSSSPVETASGYAPKRSKATIVVIVLILGVVVLFGYAGKDHFLPSVEVQVERAIAVRSSQPVTAAGQLAFQSAGWLEPAPFPTQVSALTSGVVKKVHVLEGHSVKKGALIAELVDDDILLDIEANKVLKQEIELQIRALEADVDVAKAKRAHHEKVVETARKRYLKLQEISEAFEMAGTGVPKLDKLKARHDASIQHAAIEDATAMSLVLEQQEKVAKSRLEVQKAALAHIDVKMEKLQLQLKRTKVVSPIDGVVKRLNVIDGGIVNVDGDSTEAAVIAALYDPNNLQVRVDVPLSDAAGLSIGQHTKVTVELLPDKKFEGQVTSIAGRADINRNTLQAKVKVIDADHRLRPEMLTKVQFMSVAQQEKATIQPSTEAVVTLIPESAISSGNKVWTIDRLTSTARQVEITTGAVTKEGWIEVLSGINPGQQIITSSTQALENGTRVTAEK